MLRSQFPSVSSAFGLGSHLRCSLAPVSKSSNTHGAKILGAFSSQASSSYDVAVVGGGPGGYVAAIKAAQLGLKTVCIEKRGTLGGTCLNVGCIPSKALLNISHKFHEAQHDFGKMGIKTGELSIDMSVMQAQKGKAVKGLTQGIEFLFKKNKVHYSKGAASFTKDANKLSVTLQGGGDEEIIAKNIIIATGSEPSPMPGGSITIDEKFVLTSTGALDLNDPPKHLVVIGGGIIGLELGSVYNRLGSKVTVVEYLDKITPGLDGEIGKAFQKILAKQGLNFMLSSKVVGVDVDEASGKAVVKVEATASGGKPTEIECDKILLSVGRRPYTDGLNLAALGIEQDKAGRVAVDKEFRVPSYPHIRAIGDVIVGPMLAHKAEEEGIAVAEMIAGQGGHVNYDTIPSVVYTHPEVAGVGQTEEQLKEAGVEYSKGIFPFAANSRARTNDDADGLVKILTDKKTDKILGGWIIGPNAGELIHEIVLGMEYGASSEDIARTCHAHPTLSEAVKEACLLSAFGKAIHSV